MANFDYRMAPHFVICSAAFTRTWYIIRFDVDHPAWVQHGWLLTFLELVRGPQDIKCPPMASYGPKTWTNPELLYTGPGPLVVFDIRVEGIGIVHQYPLVITYNFSLQYPQSIPVTFTHIPKSVRFSIPFYHSNPTIPKKNIHIFFPKLMDIIPQKLLCP